MQHVLPALARVMCSHSVIVTADIMYVCCSYARSRSSVAVQVVHRCMQYISVDVAHKAALGGVLSTALA